MYDEPIFRLFVVNKLVEYHPKDADYVSRWRSTFMFT